MSETILEEAHRLVNGPRRETYNHPLDNFTGIADLWSAYKGVPFTAEDVGMMMILTKVNREGFRHNRDNLVDIAGYAQCVQLVDEEKVKRFQKANPHIQVRQPVLPNDEEPPPLAFPLGSPV